MGLIADQHPAIHSVITAAGDAHSTGMQSYPPHDGGAAAGAAPRAHARREHLPALRPDGKSLPGRRCVTPCSGRAGSEPKSRGSVPAVTTTALKAENSPAGYVTRSCSTAGAASGRGTRCLRRTDQQYIDRFYRHVEPATGRHYQLGDLTGPGGAAKGNPRYEVMGVTRYWRYSREQMQAMMMPAVSCKPHQTVSPRYKRYLDEMPGNRCRTCGRISLR